VSGARAGSTGAIRLARSCLPPAVSRCGGRRSRRAAPRHFSTVALRDAMACLELILQWNRFHL
jgi:hypothetical protein